MQFDNYGTLVVMTTSAGGSLPIKNSNVKIMGAGDNNRSIVYSLLTDNDGVTKKISLPTPSASLSLSPSSKQTPYGLYDIEVSSPDFYKRKIYNIALFSGVDTVLPVNMIPKSIHRGDAKYPESNLNTIVSEKFPR